MEQNNHVKAIASEMLTHPMQRTFFTMVNIYSLYHMRNDWRSFREKDHSMTVTIVRRADNLKRLTLHKVLNSSGQNQTKTFTELKGRVLLNKIKAQDTLVAKIEPQIEPV